MAKSMNGNTKWLISLIITVFLAGGAFVAVRSMAENNKEDITEVKDTHERDMGRLEKGQQIIQSDVKKILQKL